MKLCPLCHSKIIILKRDGKLILICQNYDGIEAHYGEVIAQKEEAIAKGA